MTKRTDDDLSISTTTVTGKHLRHHLRIRLAYNLITNFKRGVISKNLQLLSMSEFEIYAYFHKHQNLLNG